VTKTSKKAEKDKESRLIELIKADTKLDSDKRMEYISMAYLYLDEFAENLRLTSIELNEKHPSSIDTWKEFLEYPVVRQYIQSFRDEAISKIADTGLMKGEKDAIGIKKVMQQNGPAINNSNIVLIRVPEKVDFEC
jgi:hypothetical protein